MSRTRQVREYPAADENTPTAFWRAPRRIAGAPVRIILPCRTVYTSAHRSCGIACAERVLTTAPYRAPSISRVWRCTCHSRAGGAVPLAVPNEKCDGGTGQHGTPACPACSSPDPQRPSPATVLRAADGIYDQCHAGGHLGTISSPTLFDSSLRGPMADRTFAKQLLATPL